MKRRDITLGEIQDECKRKKKCQECDYKEVCPARSGNEEIPERWNLTDTPRFTERQMALLKAMWDIGANIAYQLENTMMFYRKAARNEQVAVIYNRVIDFALQDGETLDLAELLGKDGESK